LADVEEENARILPQIGTFEHFRRVAAAELVAVNNFVAGPRNRDHGDANEEAILVLLAALGAFTVDNQHGYLFAHFNVSVPNVVDGDGVWIQSRAVFAFETCRESLEIWLARLEIRAKAFLKRNPCVETSGRKLDWHRRIEIDIELLGAVFI